MHQRRVPRHKDKPLGLVLVQERVDMQEQRSIRGRGEKKTGTRGKRRPFWGAARLNVEVVVAGVGVWSWMGANVPMDRRSLDAGRCAGWRHSACSVYRLGSTAT